MAAAAALIFINGHVKILPREPGKLTIIRRKIS